MNRIIQKINGTIQNIGEILLDILQTQNIHLWLDYDLTLVDENKQSTSLFNTISNIKNNTTTKNKTNISIITGRDKCNFPFNSAQEIMDSLDISKDNIFGGFYSNDDPKSKELSLRKLQFISEYCNTKPNADKCHIYIDDLLEIGNKKTYDIALNMQHRTVYLIRIDIFNNSFTSTVIKNNNFSLEKNKIGNINDMLSELYEADQKLKIDQDFQILQNQFSEYNLQITSSGKQKIHESENFYLFQSIFNTYKDSLVRSSSLNVDFNIYVELANIINKIESNPLFEIAYQFFAKTYSINYKNEFKNIIKRIFLDNKLQKIEGSGYIKNKTTSLFTHLFLGEEMYGSHITGGLHCFYRTLLLSQRKRITIEKIYKYNKIALQYHQKGQHNEFKPNGCLIGVSPLFELIMYSSLFTFHIHKNPNILTTERHQFNINKNPFEFIVYRTDEGIIESGFITVSFMDSEFIS